MIDTYLKQGPPDSVPNLAQSQHLILDGTFLGRPNGLVAAMDAQSHAIVAGRYGVSESSEAQLRAFFNRLAANGSRPKSFTVDGNRQVIRTLRKVWPDVRIQRCLIHIQRQGLVWCRNHPKTTYARKLRDIFLRVTCIHTKAQRDKFLESVDDWEGRYGRQIGARPETGYVFSDIRPPGACCCEPCPTCSITLMII